MNKEWEGGGCIPFLRSNAPTAIHRLRVVRRGRLYV